MSKKIFFSVFQKHNITSFFHFLIFVFLCFFAFSCSLNYNQDSMNNSQSPEFVFSNPTYKQIQEGKQKLEIKASTIEQYTFDNAMYAKDIDFTFYNEKNEKSVNGKCNILSANLDSEIYYLFDDIQIKSYEKNLTISGDSIKWDNNSKQLITGVQNNEKKTINIISENSQKIKVEGTGFSANGKDFSFIFTGEVSGEIVTEE